MAGKLSLKAWNHLMLATLWNDEPQEEHFQKAKPVLEKGISLNRIELSKIYFQEDRHEEAIQILENSLIETGKRDPRILSHLAIAHFHTKLLCYTLELVKMKRQ